MYETLFLGLVAGIIFGFGAMGAIAMATGNRHRNRLARIKDVADTALVLTAGLSGLDSKQLARTKVELKAIVADCATAE